MAYENAYRADASLKGKLRRRLARLAHRRPLRAAPGRPMLSVSFDDAPLTAAVAGAQILEARGLRGTYYVSAGLAGRDAPMGVCGQEADYRRLVAAGHELGCHTFSHLDCGRASAADAAAEAERNAATLAAWGAARLESFAYPYGDVAPGPKQALAPRFSTLRGLHHGVIDKGVDLNQAPAVGIEGQDGEATARRWLGEAQARKAWLILYTHDVAETPSPWGCTPNALATLIDEALAAGFEIDTVGAVARKLAA
ncbi:polysaccharide deacetylase family protein [Phenylobacterium sp.]|uniref:oligosaccharide deacetylase HfsH n=1 Tax=Phenylobacterium sp. TaxID=1871053 RepID=UPI0028A27D71|nr:polysaccharide deacetylase family protein [Phenylobacterium sp.]